MALFKINDVRVRFDKAAAGVKPAWVYIDGLSSGNPLSNKMSSVRAALMLAVFNSGRDCYWEETQAGAALVTLPAPWPTPLPKPPELGAICSWEIRVPVEEKVSFLIEYMPAPDDRPTSGNAAAAFTTMTATENDASFVLALLFSRFGFYLRGDLLNSFIVDSLANPPLQMPTPPPPFLRVVRSQHSMW